MLYHVLFGVPLGLIATCQGIGKITNNQCLSFPQCNGKDGPNSRVVHSGGKGLSKVKARVLGVALGNKSGLEVLHRPICIPLDLEVPVGTHHLLARGKLDNLPSSVPLVGLKFLQAGLLPLTGFRISLRLLEGSGLSDGGEVGIGSGVNSVIRIWIIGLVKVIRVTFLTFLITFWRVLSRGAVLIRGDSRNGISVLPDSWR